MFKRQATFAICSLPCATYKDYLLTKITAEARACITSCKLVSLLPGAGCPENHGMVWVGRDLKDHLVPPPLPWAGTPSTRPGCSKPHAEYLLKVGDGPHSMFLSVTEHRLKFIILNFRCLYLN